jgi:hypothetical protein
VTTARGRKLLADPLGLLPAIANDVLAGDDFRAACAELAVALLLAGFEADWAEPLARRVRPAIVAKGWQSNGEPPGVRDVSWAIADFIRPATASGLIETQHGDFPFHREPLVPTRAGRTADRGAPRPRARAKNTGPY